MSDVFPGLRYLDLAAAMQWLTSVLGLSEGYVARDGDRVVHAELIWGDSAVMLGQHGDGSDGRPVLPTGGGQTYLVCTGAELGAAYQRVVAGGAQVLHPLEDRGYGSGFTVADPEGNSWSFGTYRPALPPPPGSPGWLEIGVPTPQPTGDFFTALLGWSPSAMTNGNANFTSPGLRAGLHGGDEERNIVVYFTVADIDAAAARVRELGGSADDAGPEVSEFGRFAAATDPQGVAFGLYQPAAPPS